MADRKIEKLDWAMSVEVVACVVDRDTEMLEGALVRGETKETIIVRDAANNHWKVQVPHGFISAIYKAHKEKETKREI